MTNPATLRPYRVRCAGLETIIQAHSSGDAALAAMALYHAPAASARPVQETPACA